MVSSSFRELAHELVGLFRRGTRESLGDRAFDDLARRVFGYQFAQNEIYQGFCRTRGVTPDTLSHWTRIPAVPTRAFKSFQLVSGSPEDVDVVFRTSGTSRGAGERGEHHVLDLRLYRESLLSSFRDHLLADGARLPLVSLIPSPAEAPDSSLSHMMGVVEEELTAEGGGWFVDPETGLREEALAGTLAELEERERPVLLAGTAFSFVHWLDAMEGEGWRFDLPPGSRIMETGGFKGRSRAVSREELHGGLARALGVEADRIVNEYGMTELLSQFYDSGGGPHRGPPWVRTRVLDPVTLEEREPGETGILCHLDLANLGSVSCILTEDLGVAEDDGFRVLGRTSGSEPRGCSLAMDELLGSTA